VTVSTRIRRLVVEAPNSVGGRARARRWELLTAQFPDFESYRVVDLGGTVDAWLQTPLRPAHVTVLNLSEPGTSDQDWITAVTGDACDAPTVLAAATGEHEYDFVYSNAVLEHVGGHANRERFARAARELAPRHWVQTPYRYFPLEPHWLFPGMQFLPVAARAQIAVHWPLAHSPARSVEEGRSAVLWTDLIGIAEMQEYFPTSRLHYERAAGLVKSIVAIGDVERWG
jgi:hypothetical protein